MSQHLNALDRDLERMRPYLCILARRHLDRSLWRLIDPSDVVQRTLMDAHCKRDQCQGQTEAERRAWVRRMLLNDLKDAVRKFGRIADHERHLQVAADQSSIRIDAALAAEQSSPSDGAIKQEQLWQLANALEQLSGPEREVVTLHYLFDWTQPEIAKHVGRTRPAVAGLLHRGLDKLRKLMGHAE